MPAETQTPYWLGFSLVKGVGSTRVRGLLQFFGDLETAWNASPADLHLAGLGEKIVQNLTEARASVDLSQLWENIQAQDIQILTWDDADYPKKLREIDQPPPVLFTRGSLLEADAWAVGVVGTRRITSYGRQVAEELAAYLAHHGVTVVSGLARGVDAVAHQAALQAGGRTLAVLGSGVDRIYPPEHRKLAEEITRQGALLSDYFPGTPPEGVNFPPRNRIISGLSLGVVVVEAGRDSGALITANFALEQGREVFAVPGNITAPQSKGANRLIQQGARPLLGPEEVLECLDISRITEFRQARMLFPADEVETRLLETLGAEPVHVDEICYRTKLPVEKVSAALIMMELKGMVRQVGGMHYVALHEASPGYGEGA